MQQLSILLKWARINAASLLAGFLVTGAFVALFPETMLGIFGGLAKFYETLGARSASEFSSQAKVFFHILQRNAIAAVVVFVVGLLVQAPLGLLLGGTFYGFVAFLAPLTIGRSFGHNDWLLVAVEASALILSGSLASALASELYGVTASFSGWWNYFANSWRSLTMRPVRSTRTVLARWAPILGLGWLAIGGFLLFVAWFETYGY